MTKKFWLNLMCSLVFGVAACGPGAVSNVTGTTTVDDSFSVDGTRWQGNDALSLLFFRTQEKAGFVEICGAIVTQGSGIYKSLEGQVLQGSYITLEGETVANSITFFNRLPQVTSELEPQDVLGKQARCATTGVAWRDAFVKAEPKLVFRFSTATY